MRSQWKIAGAIALVFSILPPPNAAAEEAVLIEVNETYFPDAQFRAYLQGPVNESNEGVYDADINKINAGAVQHLYMAGKNISSLTGIGCFTALLDLNIDNNPVSELPLSDEAKKTVSILYASKTRLIASDGSLNIKLSEYTNLNRLECNELYDADGNAALSVKIDVPESSKLTALACGGHGTEGYLKLTIPESVSNNITIFTCNNCPGYQPDLSKFTGLEWLNCSNNNITKLDLTQVQNLKHFDCTGNTGLSTYLSEYDFANNPNLEDLWCGFCDVTALDLDGNTEHLRHLRCTGNQLSSLDVTKCAGLTMLECQNNQNLTALDVTQNVALTYLECSVCYNLSGELDLSKNTKLNYFSSWGDHKVTGIIVPETETLEVFSCPDNSLSSIDVSKNPNLRQFFCNGNQLQTLDLTQNKYLWNLNCGYNQLLSLDLSKCSTSSESNTIVSPQTRHLGTGWQFNLPGIDAANGGQFVVADVSDIVLQDGTSGSETFRQEGIDMPIWYTDADDPEHYLETGDLSFPLVDQTYATYNYKTHAQSNVLMEVKVTRDVIATSITEAKTGTCRVYAADGEIVVEGARGSVAVYSVAGTLVTRIDVVADGPSRIGGLSSGIYIVAGDGFAVKCGL